MATMTAPVADTKRIPGGSFLITDPAAADCFFPEDFTDEQKQINSCVPQQEPSICRRPGATALGRCAVGGSGGFFCRSLFGGFFSAMSVSMGLLPCPDARLAVEDAPPHPGVFRT